MSDIIQTLLQNQPWGMIIVVVLICSAAGIVTAVIKETRKYACHRKDAELKRELVERGLNVEEIERVVRAQSTERADTEQKC